MAESQPAATTAQTTATPNEKQDQSQQQVSDETETTPLPRRFLATASGPVTRITDHGEGTTERVRAEITIEHSIETLEGFAVFWTLRDRVGWKAAALEHLVEIHEPDGVAYAVAEDDLEAWEVTVDGRVEVFAGLVKAIDGYVGDPTRCSEIPHTIANRIRGRRRDNRSADDVIGAFATELRRADLWGAGAHLALLNVKYARHEEIEQSAAKLVRALSDDGGET